MGKFDKFLKGAFIEIAGDSLGFSNKEKERLKQSDDSPLEFFENMYGTALDSVDYYDSELSKYGIDYHYLASLKTKEEKNEYLRSVGIESQSQLSSIMADIKRRKR